MFRDINYYKSLIMLKNILKLEGVQTLDKEKQIQVNGGGRGLIFSCKFAEDGTVCVAGAFQLGACLSGECIPN